MSVGVWMCVYVIVCVSVCVGMCLDVCACMCVCVCVWECRREVGTGGGVECLGSYKWSVLGMNPGPLNQAPHPILPPCIMVICG